MSVEVESVGRTAAFAADDVAISNFFKGLGLCFHCFRDYWAHVLYEPRFLSG